MAPGLLLSGLFRSYINRVYIGVILGLYWDNGKENGNYYNGLYRDYKVYIGVILGYIGMMDNKMEAIV